MKKNIDNNIEIFKDKLKKYNNNNIFIVGSVGIGKTSVLLKIIENNLLDNQKIFLIDGEDEINKIYRKKTNKNIKSIFISDNLKRLKNFMSSIKEGNMIVIDGFQLLHPNVITYIKDLVNSGKYKIIIACDHPVRINLSIFNYIFALRTIRSYSIHLGYNTTELKKGDCLINGKYIIKFPFLQLINYKKHLVINSKNNI